jgi:radical SAM protein with 4Fe4S-binding SPASM domain
MDCPTLPELDITEWGKDLRERLKGQRYPLSGMFELTDRCNLGCVHCYIRQPVTSHEARSKELSLSQVKHTLDQAVEAGCLFLTFTGGEVLLRSDFSEIYQYSRRLGILSSFFTNGTLLTPHLADMLVDVRPRQIEITLYGATQETYERVTQVPGSFRRCRQGIDLLLERGLPVYLKSSIITLNQHELSEMRSLADQLGVEFRYDTLMWPKLNGNQEPLGYQLAAREMIALDAEDEKRQNEWLRIAEQFSGRLVRSEYLYSCGAGLQNFHIDSAGRMSICTMSRRSSYDLREMSFQVAWEQLGHLRKVKSQIDTTCRTCMIGGLCAQCPGWSQAVHNDDETPVDFICELAHLRNLQVEAIIVE